MEVSLKKAFTIIDGRLSTEMRDVYEMLNYIFDTSLFTHQLPAAMRKIRSLNPDFYRDGRAMIEKIKKEHNTNDFEMLMKVIDEDYSETKIILGRINEQVPFLRGLVQDVSESQKQPTQCPECFREADQNELDTFGGLCEECSGAFDD